MWRPSPPAQGQSALIAPIEISLTKPGHLTLDGRGPRAPSCAEWQALCRPAFGPNLALKQE
jgi:hypothetical protein